VLSIDKNLAVYDIKTMDERIADATSQTRFSALVLGLFATVALILSAIGIYGVMSYAISARRREIGIRMALGAERRGVIAMVMRGAIVQTALGLAIGIPIAFLCVRFVKAQLYEITNADAGVMAVAIITLAAAACVAGMIPARRAASTDPVQALRTE